MHAIRPVALLLVALGGAAGSSLRWLASETIQPSQDFPWATLAVNLIGAFALGYLLENLLRAPHSAASDKLRLALGTGVLGGFTTYSTFAVELARALSAGLLGPAVLYAGVSLAGGVALAGTGVLLASHRSRTDSLPQQDCEPRPASVPRPGPASGTDDSTRGERP